MDHRLSMAPGVKTRRAVGEISSVPKGDAHPVMADPVGKPKLARGAPAGARKAQVPAKQIRVFDEQLARPGSAAKQIRESSYDELKRGVASPLSPAKRIQIVSPVKGGGSPYRLIL